ncbi:cell envelope integrity protein CreD [Magnetospirillum aberrantis]|uniref:Cell envelope integrity protein CreD n=1 Tax=Magnetospirillum aberrantis SpK TaxID=908842 RepID=A0A7C9UWZ8_9PROT|nr:cell envelope integrity protein CreD [Magnetospirillum aberrantis SpK]
MSAAVSTRKLLQMAAILLLTVVAGWMVASLVDEREARQRELLSDFTKSWGPRQVVHVPTLVVPYRAAADRPWRYLKFAPARYAAEGALSPEWRRRGLFAAPVYGMALTVDGRFVVPEARRLTGIAEPGGSIAWERAFITVEATDLSRLGMADGMQVDGTMRSWQACREVVGRDEDCQGSVLAVPVALTAQGGTVPFQMVLTLRGVGGMRLASEGRNGTLALSAPWPTPSFVGSALPETSTVGENGFTAHWSLVNPAGRQMWTQIRADAVEADAVQVGVDLLEATPTYRMVNRVSKYGILIVALSFTVYFLFELLSGLRIHAAQYALLGASLTLFPLLLVSLAEPLGFVPGYAAASALVLAQASGFTALVTRRWLAAGGFLALLAGLFGFIYVLLRLETYALLSGSLALFVVLSAVMVLTGRVNWWGERA